MKILIPLFVLAFLLISSKPVERTLAPQAVDSLALPSEKHLHNMKQLTFGGQNAEAYFSLDGHQLIFQSQRDGRGCDQIYTMNTDGSNVSMVSTGDGRTTCSYFFPNKQRILYSSTHGGARECPPKPDYSHGYVWPIYSTYDIYTACPDGSDLKQLTNTPGYDAEATISTDGRKIVFTSMRDGDLDVYTMDADGKHVRRLTTELGYDGGAFFSNDGRRSSIAPIIRRRPPKLRATNRSSRRT